MNRKKTSDVAKKLRRQHGEIRAILPGLCEQVCRQLERMISDNDISLGFPVQHRIKTWSSTAEKITRLGLNLTDIHELQDLVGFRLVFLFRRDAIRAQSLVSSMLEVFKRVDAADSLSEDQFGYMSVHLLAKLPEQWLKLPTLTPYKDFSFEIQIRTMAQHIWAEASHQLQYKREQNVPKSVRRSLSRASALLESLDLEFERVLEERATYRETASATPASEKLNVDVLEAVLDEYFPAANKKGTEDYSAVLADLIHFNMDTRGSLERLLHAQTAKAVEEDAKIAAGLAAGEKTFTDRFVDDKPETTPEGIFYSHTGLLRQCMELEIGTPWTEYQKSQRESV